MASVAFLLHHRLLYTMYRAAGVSIPASSSTIASRVPTVDVGLVMRKDLQRMRPGDLLVHGGHRVVMYIGA